MSGNDPEHPTARWARTEIEVAAGPDEVWQAIATGPGNAAWLFPADIETKEGGTMLIHREPFASDATATVTTWDPPHRFGYEQPLRAADGSVAAAPLATEILIEARSGGTCIVRVVSGLHHDGDGWEDLIDGAGEGWRMSLTVLRGYLRYFAGQPAARIDAIGTVGRPLGDQAAVATAVMRQLGMAGRSAGQRFRTLADTPPLAGSIEHLSGAFVLLRASEPGPALFAISIFPMDGVTLSVNVTGRLFGPGSPALAEREQPRWRAWLASRTGSPNRI